MPKLFFVLSKENIPLAVEEVLTLAKQNKYTLFDDVLVLDTLKKDLHKRLSFTKSIYEFLFECNKKDLIKTINSFDWQKHYKKNFKLVLHHSTNLNEKYLAGLIWNKLKNPTVKMKNPKTSFELFCVNNRVFAGKKIGEVESLEQRRAKYRPAKHPTSMHPKLARALVNLTGIEKGTFYDPFCGVGGILIEAGLMNFKVIGYDIMENQLEKAKINLDFYKIKNYQLKKQDSTKIKHKIDYLATDLPYGRGSTAKDLPNLYQNFLNNLKKVLQTRAVIVFPQFVDYKKMLKNHLYYMQILKLH